MHRFYDNFEPTHNRIVCVRQVSRSLSGVTERSDSVHPLSEGPGVPVHYLKAKEPSHLMAS